MEEPSDLVQAVRKQLAEWFSAEPEEEPPYARVEAKEGRLFFGYDAKLDRIDLSIFTINDQFKKKGIARSIIENAIKTNRKVVAITGIMPGGWFESIKNYKFDGFTTNIVPRSPWEHFNIEFVNESLR